MSGGAGDLPWTIAVPGVTLVCRHEPWDSAALGAPAAAIGDIAVAPDAAVAAIAEAAAALRDRLAAAGIALASARVPSRDLRATMLLEAAGFRWVELVLDPFRAPLPAVSAPDGVVVRPAETADLPVLGEIAATAFTTGRHALDPRLDPGLAGRRYRRWLETSVGDPRRTILAAHADGDLAGLFLTESPADGTVRWLLTAIAPAAQGRGIGRRVWSAVLALHAAAGIERVETTISTHNVAVLNLYAQLGFRFGEPRASFHWVPG